MKLLLLIAIMALYPLLALSQGRTTERIISVPFSQLSTSHADGSTRIVINGTAGAPCTVGPSQVLAVKLNGVWTCTDLTASGGSGGAPISATFITQTPSSGLTAEQALSAMATGILKGNTGTGVVTIASAGTDYLAPAGNGSLLTTLNATQLTSGTVPDARFPATLPAASGVNLTALNASMLASGTVPDARFPATLPALSGANLTALSASNLSSGTIPDARFPATLPALSGVNLTSLNASNLGSGTLPDARFPAILPTASGINLTALNAANLASGTVVVARGGTGLGVPAEDQLIVGNGTDYDLKTLPSCSSATNDKLLYNSTTNTFSCGSDQTTGEGSGITSLGGLTGAIQTFSKTDDTNVTLTVTSTGTDHNFALGFTGTLADARVADNITLTNITQITNRALSDTTGDLAASRVDDGGVAATQALFSGAGSAAGFRAIADADIPNTITIDLATLATTATTANTGDSATAFFSSGTIEAARLPDAVADGATKGIASFTAADFNASSGNISIDYANGQVASGSVNGFLASADWTTFNAKAPTASPTFTGTVTIPTPFTLGAVSVLPTGTELNFVDGVTSSIQTQLDSKQASDTDLTTIAGLAATTDNFIVSVASAWASRTPAQVKTTLALNNVDNTSDAGKPVSTAQQTALDLKANLAGPTFTGTVTFPTPFTLGAVSVLPTGTELNFVDGVTSSIQTQLNARALAGAVASSGLTMATARLLGRTTASAGAVEEITVGSGLSLSGGTLTATGGGSGDMLLGTNQTVTARKLFNPATLVIGNVATPPTPELGSLFVDTDDGKLYYGIDGSTHGEIFVSGLSVVNLASANVSGDLPFANFVPAAAASKLVGRGSASGAGDFEEITIGSGLTMTGTTLSSSGSATIVNGTSALGTSAISSGTCATVVTTTATGTATTDTIGWGFNGDPTGVTGYAPTVNGMLTIIGYPSTNNVNWKVCNNTSASVTPGAITLNWRIMR